MTLNKEALLLFENNQYDEALHLFEEAVKIERTVQSLNNLAWIYLNEEEDPHRAKIILEEVIELKPKSHFPYNMLGEIALKEKRRGEAKDILKKSLTISYSTQAVHNLAVAHYYLGDFVKASIGFHEVAKDSDMTSWYEVMAHIQNNDYPRAKSILARWNDQSDDYVGAIEAAEAYLEMDCFREARHMFEKEWHEYYLTNYLVSRYAYTLFQLGDYDACREIIHRAIDFNNTEIIDEKQKPCDEHWTIHDKEESLATLQFEKIELEQLYQKIQTGFRPPITLKLYSEGGCYLFGCERHQHPEYK